MCPEGGDGNAVLPLNPSPLGHAEPHWPPRFSPTPSPCAHGLCSPWQKLPTRGLLDGKQALSYFCDFRAEHMVVLTSSRGRHYH